MATSREFEHLSVPTPLGAGLCPSSPSGASSLTDGSAGSGSDAGSGGVRSRLTILARSVSNQSHRSSFISTSSHRSISSVRSHVSTFQNVRFDPDPIKDISFWGGLALLISNMTGPGLVTLPIVAQSAGWLPTVLGFVLVGILSTLSSLFICEAMTEVPGNEYFQSNVEFSNLVECFFGRRYHLLVQIICFLAMQTTNIASIAISAQLFDNLLIKIFSRTCGIQVYPNPSFICVTEQLQAASPFTGVMIMTAGVLLAFSMILPLGLLKLSENIWVQLASFVLMLLIVLQWIVTFFIHGLDTTLVPAVGSDIGQTFGTILFNYAFITTVPSWANAKQPNVSIHKTVGYSVCVTTIIYLMVAIIGGMAFQISNNSSLIQAINSSPDVTILSQITGYTFPIAALITSIPINIIVIRYNLIQSGACNLLWSNILAGVLPWLIAVPCMTGSGLTAVINWSSLFLVSTANFIIPFILYIYSKKHREKLNKLPIIEMEQQARLSREASRTSFTGQSRRNTSVSGSIRRRQTGSSQRIGSQSHPDLTIAPQTGIAAATVLPVAVGIGGSGMVRQSISDDNLVSESSRQGTHHRHRNHQLGSFGLSNMGAEAGEPVSGPYFSYSRDGEVFERESKPTAVDPSDPRSQASSVHRPSGVSTVILHDPVTEMAQRKGALPRRVSHKDKILSMISEKHKRAVEQQAKVIQEEQNEKPVPPMILLSQSTAPEPDDELYDEAPQFGIYAHSNGSSESENYCEKDAVEVHQGVGSSEADTEQSTIIKKVNRRSSITPLRSHSPLALPQSPSSPPGPNASMPGVTGADQLPHHDKAEISLEPSPTLSPPRSPSGPQKSALKRSGSNASTRAVGIGHESIVKPSNSLSASTSRDSLRSEKVITNSSRLGPGSSTPTSAQPPGCSPSTPDSAGSVHSLERRVSFSDDHRLTLSPPELERKSSFGEGTKRAVKAAVATLRSVSPSRLGSSSGAKSRDGKSASTGWRMALLENPGEIEEIVPAADDDDDKEVHDTIGPELEFASPGINRGAVEDKLRQFSQERRDSYGRMAAAFVSQPGSFAIQTTAVQPSTTRVVGSGVEDGSHDTTPAVPELSFSVSDPTFRKDSEEQGHTGSGGGDGETIRPQMSSLSPSVPPSFQIGQSLSGRNHSRTVSAFADLQESSSRSRRPTARVQSTQSLKEKAQHLAAFDPINHLMPPSPSLTQRPRFDASSPTSAEARDSVGPLASNPPSPQRSPSGNYRASLGHRNSRYGSSGKVLPAPFQAGNNYSIPGFSSSRPQSSPVCPPPPSPGSQPQQEQQQQSAHGFGSSWFSLRGHSRDPSRSTMASLHRAPSVTGSIPPSPKPSMAEIGKRGGPVLEHLRDSSMSGDVLALDAIELERGEFQQYESGRHPPQYAATDGGHMGGLALDAQWSLRAIPAWVPLSSLKVAWGALVVLALAICATIVYDFVQLGLGNDVVSGS
ncbi:hypothetical protein BGX28_000274 [Mortierella sp. GBA30]|nr:hypothetical protein BGX28_000274 [Mortierella sp. GBA30]